MNNKGFTLIELIVAVAVIIIIAGLAAPNMMSSLNHEQEEADGILIIQLNDATESYAMVSGLSLDYDSSDFVFSDCKTDGLLDYDLMIYKLIENGFMIAIPEPQSPNTEFQWDSAAQEWKAVSN